MTDLPAGDDGHRGRPPGRGGGGSRPPNRRGAGPGPKSSKPARRRPGPPARHSGPRPGAIGLTRLAGGDFELVHPRCVHETQPDYEEGLELWREGDPEGARDALRYALSACQQNLWIHVALGKIALEEFHDPTLARGHFGYAVDLARRALSPSFSGRLPPDRSSNRPFFEALDGLIRCLEALGRREECRSLRALHDRLATGGP